MRALRGWSNPWFAFYARMDALSVEFCPRGNHILPCRQGWLCIEGTEGRTFWRGEDEHLDEADCMRVDDGSIAAAGCVPAAQ
jgi:hypothetical protein